MPVLGPVKPELGMLLAPPTELVPVMASVDQVDDSSVEDGETEDTPDEAALLGAEGELLTGYFSEVQGVQVTSQEPGAVTVSVVADTEVT